MVDDGSEDGTDFAAQRERLVARLVAEGTIERSSTAAAMRAVPRHAFVPADRRSVAYADRPLPIGEGQTISAPHMVAAMTDELALDADDRVLEIGTGCGYHAAVTAAVVGAVADGGTDRSDEGDGDEVERTGAETGVDDARDDRGRVYSVEYEPALAERARATLSRLGYDVAVRTGDGHEGWPEHAPYDAAYLTCAPAAVPDAVVEQVRPGGRVVAPVGDRRQRLVTLHRRADGGVDREEHGGVRFVPMRGG